MNSASLPKQIYFYPANLMDIFRMDLIDFPLHNTASAVFTSYKATLFPPPLYLPEGGLHHCIAKTTFGHYLLPFIFMVLSFYQVLTDRENPQEPKI